MRRALALFVLWCAASSPLVAQAQPKPEPACPAAPPPRPRASISRIADDLARDLSAVTGRAIVTIAPIEPTQSVPRADALARAIAAQLAGRRGEGTVSLDAPMSLAEARAQASSAPLFIHLEASLRDGLLRVSADVFPVPKTVWARIREPEPGPLAHVYAEAPIDAEVRSYLAPVPLAKVSVVRAKNFESDVVAIACGDLDDDGALEIVSLSRRRVTMLRLGEGRVLPLASRSLSDLDPVSPSPLREPLAFATIHGEGAATSLDLALTDRAHGLRLDGKLELKQSFAALPLPERASTACAGLRGLFVAGPLSACAAGDQEPSSASLARPVDAYASTELTEPSGATFGVWAAREAQRVTMRDDAGRTTAVGAGAQLAVGDLDQDGEPELLASLDVLDPLKDAVVVRSWSRAAGQLIERARIPAAAGVRALAVCPPDDLGAAPFVVATADEIWLVRFGAAP